MRERADANRTREVGRLDEIQGVVANSLNSFPNGAVGFIDWLDRLVDNVTSNLFGGLSQDSRRVSERPLIQVV